MDVKKIFKKQFAQMLHQAEKEHAKYEKELGKRDENWHEWYADWIVEKMPEDTFKLFK